MECWCLVFHLIWWFWGYSMQQYVLALFFPIFEWHLLFRSTTFYVSVISWCTLWLLPLSGYCEKCCYEYSYASFSVWIYVFISLLSRYFRVQLPEHMANLCSTFKEIAYLPKWLCGFVPHQCCLRQNTTHLTSLSYHVSSVKKRIRWKKDR